jgi:hypothetical protein
MLEITMPSPFPGMNPFLEQSDAWMDFHDNFIVRIQEALSDRVGPNYLVMLEVRLILHERSAEERGFFGIADVGVSDTSNRLATSDAMINSAPLKLKLPAVEIEKHRSLEIRDRRNRKIITVIEFLSPSNKTAGVDRDDYLAKRRQVLSSPTHLVEIDLRRGGTRPSPPDIPPCDYYVLVSRHEDRPHVGVWPIGLRDQLPRIPIPLMAPDSPVWLDLKGVLDRTYDGGGYGKYIYEGEPEPSLTEADMKWARGISLGTKT